MAIAQAAFIVVTKTKYHTAVATQTHTSTQFLTQWSTSLQSYDGPTTTTTSTILTTVTLDQDDSSPTTSSFQELALSHHNAVRALHVDTETLLWSETVALSAQSYADRYDCSGSLTHSHGQYGENLALGYNTTAAVQAWYNEVSLYDWSNPVFSERTGHFTQIVWLNTTEVGCGYKDCGSYYGQYTVCQYNAPGNYAGLFEKNVMPLIS
ncbi:Cell wall protein PRY3 [Cyberlindnera fabianii]|nr:Cell wall protein PRY3 [Cyberlindnera fabianii]